MTTVDAVIGTSERRRALGTFIRLHRERASPAPLGLDATGRRRTPGLCREDLAQLCAVSATWITWIEQGRKVAASPRVLTRLAAVLQLAPAERIYLFDLAGRHDPTEPVLPGSCPPDAVIQSVHALRCPAYVLDRGWHIAAANAQAAELFLGWGADSYPQPANLLRFLFFFPGARELIDDWQARARRLVAEFRADCGHLINVAPIAGLVQELTSDGCDFARFWQTHEVLEREGGERRFQHPRHGALVFEQLTLHPAVRSDLKLVILLELRG